MHPIALEALGAVQVLCVEDEISIANAAELSRSIELLESRSSAVIVSFERCHYCDASCLSVILTAARRLGRRFALVFSPNAPVHRIFDISGIVKQPYVFASLEEALKTVRS